MKFDKEPTDEQLDELLRDIDVPQDLKSVLKQIPSSDGLDDGKVGLKDGASNAEEEPTWTGALLGLILAASLIGVGLFIGSASLPETDKDSPVAKSPTTEVEKNGDELKNGDEPEPKSAVRPTNVGLAQSEIDAREIRQLEAQIHAIKIAQMEAELFEIERTTAVQVDQREVESVIAAVAEQYSVPLGMPEAKAKSRMAQVIEQFPGTRGAEMAQSYLEQEQDN